jgi:hypothetical protein
MRFPSDDRNAVVAGSQNARCLHIPVTGLTAIWVRHRKPLHNAPREMRRNTPVVPWERSATTQEEKMSVFGNIVSAIFGSKHAAGVTAAAGSSSPPPSSPATSASAGTAAGATAAAKPISKADVEAILAKLADEQDEDLDWKSSIVDLMKLLKLDSGLGARKQLAQELGYTGALDGSAAMNVWLQKQVMTKLAESGGKVPDSLRA